MYKRDRALKQQKKALIQASGFRIENNRAFINHQRGLMFTGGLLPLPILHSTALHDPESDHISYQPASRFSLLPSNSLGPTEFASLSDGADKSEYINNCASSSDGSYQPYSRPFSPQGSRMPHLVMEFMRCDPDELLLQNKIATHLLQELKDWGKGESPNTFSLMCLIADQTLFSIVEWARTSIFFTHLNVRSSLLNLA